MGPKMGPKWPKMAKITKNHSIFAKIDAIFGFWVIFDPFSDPFLNMYFAMSTMAITYKAFK